MVGEPAFHTNASAANYADTFGRCLVHASDTQLDPFGRDRSDHVHNVPVLRVVVCVRARARLCVRACACGRWLMRTT
jgi:hypothetical protein